MAGRPSAVDRSARVGFDIAQREVDVERRRKDLGGQPGGDPAQRQLGRQCTDRRAANARIDQLAGLKALGVAAPRAATCPRSSGIRSVVVVPMSIKSPRAFRNQACRQGRQRQPVCRRGQVRLPPSLGHRVKLAVNAPDDDRTGPEGPRRTASSTALTPAALVG